MQFCEKQKKSTRTLSDETSVSASSSTVRPEDASCSCKCDSRKSCELTSDSGSSSLNGYNLDDLPSPETAESRIRDFLCNQLNIEVIRQLQTLKFLQL